MAITLKQGKELYTEDEAAEILGITRQRLHMLLDEHIFQDGTEKPEELTFRVTDLLMIGFWNRGEATNVVKMPRR